MTTYSAVRTTGIYCRPGCGAKPRAENIPFTAPYDWAAMAELLRQSAIPGAESVVDNVYRRTIMLDGAPGMLEIGPGGADHLLLRAHLPYWEGVIHVVARAARLVGVDVDPVAARAALAGDPVLGPLVRERPGRAGAGAVDGVRDRGRHDWRRPWPPARNHTGSTPRRGSTSRCVKGDRDAFPATDPAPTDPDRWRPWRSLATVHLRLRDTHPAARSPRCGRR